MAAEDSRGKKGKKGGGGITNDAAHFFRQQFGKDLQYDENTCKWLCIVPECQFTADSTARVKRHVRRVHLKLGNWKCEICEKEGRPTQKFTNLTNLNHHITGVHHGYSTKYRSKEELICDICGITKFGKTKMELHKIRVHTHLRPWVCTHCGKRFTTKHDLKRHEERAQGNCHLPKFQRTYSYLRCPFACNGRFSSQEELDQHLKMKEVNNGECPRIPKKKGMRGEFPCEHCGQVYTYRESLQKHLRMNHANRSMTSLELNFSSLLKNINYLPGGPIINEPSPRENIFLFRSSQQISLSWSQTFEGQADTMSFKDPQPH